MGDQRRRRRAGTGVRTAACLVAVFGAGATVAVTVKAGTRSLTRRYRFTVRPA